MEKCLEFNIKIDLYRIPRKSITYTDSILKLYNTTVPIQKILEKHSSSSCMIICLT